MQVNYDCQQCVKNMDNLASEVRVSIEKFARDNMKTLCIQPLFYNCGKLITNDSSVDSLLQRYEFQCSH